MIALILIIFTAACAKNVDDPDRKTAHAFAEALHVNQPAKALQYIRTEDRNDDTFQHRVDSDAKSLDGCKKESQEHTTRVQGPDQRVYRVDFGNSCGDSRSAYTSVAPTLLRQDEHWVVSESSLRYSKSARAAEVRGGAAVTAVALSGDGTTVRGRRTSSP
jgi:hypothetical protein